MISLPLSSEHEGITEDIGGTEAGPVPIRAPLRSAHSGPASSKGSKRPISCELGGRSLPVGRCAGGGMAKQGPRDGACHMVVQKYRRRHLHWKFRLFGTEFQAECPESRVEKGNGMSYA